MNDYDDSAPEEIELPEVHAPDDVLSQISSFLAKSIEEEARVSSATEDYLDRLYEEIGDPEAAATMIISYIQQRHGWEMEIILDRATVEEMLFKRFSAYDEAMWQKVINSKAVSDLHHEVWKLSHKYGERAIQEIMDKEEDWLL